MFVQIDRSLEKYQNASNGGRYVGKLLHCGLVADAKTNSLM